MTNNEAIIRTAEQPNSRTAEQPNSRTSNFPLVSIIIPAYNTEPYIHRAIESSLRQTHKNLEVIVIDDGSTDNTLSIAQKYEAEDARVRVFHQENAGVSAARNHALNEAKGEYITFLDSDDWLEDNAIEILIDAQIKYPDKLIAANFYSVKEDFTKSLFIKNFTSPAFYDIHDIAESYCGVGDAHAVFHSAWAKIYSSQILAHIVKFPEGVGFSEDAAFVITYLHKVKGAFALPVPIYNMYSRTGSAERSDYNPKMLQSQIDAHEIMINHPDNTPEVRELLSISRSNLIIRYAAAGMSGKMKGIDSAEIRKIRNLLKPKVREYMSCKKLSVKRKAAFFCKMYLPIPICCAVLRTWGLVKKLLGRS